MKKNFTEQVCDWTYLFKRHRLPLDFSDMASCSLANPFLKRLKLIPYLLMPSRKPNLNRSGDTHIHTHVLAALSTPHLTLLTPSARADLTNHLVKLVLCLDPSASPADVIFAISPPVRSYESRDQEVVYCISVSLRERGGYRRPGQVVKIIEGRSEEGWEDAIRIFRGRLGTWWNLEGLNAK